MENNKEKEKYPDFFQSWNDFMKTGQNPGFYEPDEFTEIIEIYIEENEMDKARKTIDHALNVYSDDQVFLYDIFLLISDYELWNDLLNLSLKYSAQEDVWIDSHRLTALLHLGMEEEAFLYFRKMKSRYNSSEEDLLTLYQAMGEALSDMDLFDSSIDVMKEAISNYGEDVDSIWLLLQNYFALDDKEKILEHADKIQKINPLDAETWHRLGVIYSEIDELENAIESLENAHLLGYNPQKNLLVLMTVYEKNGNYNKVLEKAKEYLNLYPNSYQILILAAKASRNVENWQESLSYISKAIEIMPEMESLYLFQSSLYLETGEVIKAKKSLEKGINTTKDPDGELWKELKRIIKNNK